MCLFQYYLASEKNQKKHGRSFLVVLSLAANAQDNGGGEWQNVGSLWVPGASASSLVPFFLSPEKNECVTHDNFDMEYYWIWNRTYEDSCSIFETSRIFEELLGLEDTQPMCRSELLRVLILISPQIILRFCLKALRIITFWSQVSGPEGTARFLFQFSIVFCSSSSFLRLLSKAAQNMVEVGWHHRIDLVCRVFETFWNFCTSFGHVTPDSIDVPRYIQMAWPNVSKWPCRFLLLSEMVLQRRRFRSSKHLRPMEGRAWNYNVTMCWVAVQMKVRQYDMILYIFVYDFSFWTWILWILWQILTDSGMQNKSCTTSFELCARRWAPVAELILHANISCIRNVVDNNGQMATDSQTWLRGVQAADDLYKKHADLLVELSVLFAVCQRWVFVAMPVVQNARLWSTNALVAPRHRLESRNSWRSCSDSLIFDPTSQCLQMWHFWGFFSQ